MSKATEKLPRIFVINLERADERRESIQKQLDSLNLPFEFFKATDGKFFTENEQALYSKKETIKLLGYELLPNELACSMSHIRLYEKIVADEIPVTLILEDDAKLDSALVEVLSNLNQLPEDWGVINLGSATYTYPLGQQIANGFQLSEYRKPPKFTVAYLVTLQAAKQMLEVAYPIRCPSDFLLGRSGMKYFKTYGSYPRLIGQIREAGEGSDIGVRLHRPNLMWRIKRYLRLFLPMSLRNIPNLPDGTETKSLLFSLKNRYKRP